MKVSVKDEVVEFEHGTGEGDTYEEKTTTRTWAGTGADATPSALELVIDRANKKTSVVRERRPPTATPRVDDNERHVVLDVHMSEGHMSLENVRLGVGPASVYPDRERALRLELLDREGSAFSAIAIEDPLRVRAYYQDVSTVIADPVVARSEADTYFVLPLDPRLTAVHLLGEGYFAEPIALSEQIRNLCAADTSEVCRLYLQ